MQNELTHQEFVSEVNKIYSDVKVLSEYINLKSRIEIETRFGKCIITASKLLKGSNITIFNAVDKQNYWVNQLSSIHNNKYDYSLAKYINSETKVKVICPVHGLFEIAPSNHYSKKGCKKCGMERLLTSRTLTQETFIQKANIKHNKFYTYDKAIYINGNSILTITCPVHGDFKQIGESHLYGNGCAKCAKDKMSKKFAKGVNIFIEEALVLHNNKYNYSLVNYKNNKTKVIIICPIHGQFKQKPDSHLSGSGCNDCGNLTTQKKNQENPSGWTYTDWIKSSTTSPNFESYKVYIIRCWDENETFYKIGRTYNKVERRFHSTTLPYKYEIISVIEGDGRTICELEHRLQKLNRDHKYLPKKEFYGMYECFKDIEFKQDYTLINQNTITNNLNYNYEYRNN